MHPRGTCSAEDNCCQLAALENFRQRRCGSSTVDARVLTLDVAEYYGDVSADVAGSLQAGRCRKATGSIASDVIGTIGERAGAQLHHAAPPWACHCRGIATYPVSAFSLRVIMANTTRFRVRALTMPDRPEALVCSDAFEPSDSGRPRGLARHAGVVGRRPSPASLVDKLGGAAAGCARMCGSRIAPPHGAAAARFVEFHPTTLVQRMVSILRSIMWPPQRAGRAHAISAAQRARNQCIRGIGSQRSAMSARQRCGRHMEEYCSREECSKHATCRSWPGAPASARHGTSSTVQRSTGFHIGGPRWSVPLRQSSQARWCVGEWG